MFAELTKKLVADAIRTETAQAIKNYGENTTACMKATQSLKKNSTRRATNTCR